VQYSLPVSCRREQRGKQIMGWLDKLTEKFSDPEEVKRNFFKAVEGNRGAEVKRVLDNHPEALGWGGEFKAPLVVAASHGHMEILTLLLDRAVGQDLGKLHGARAMFEAARMGQEKAVRLLIERGAPVAVVPDLCKNQKIIAMLKDPKAVRDAELLRLDVVRQQAIEKSMQGTQERIKLMKRISFR
jgi:hypothetical protein